MIADFNNQGLIDKACIINTFGGLTQAEIENIQADWRSNVRY